MEGIFVVGASRCHRGSRCSRVGVEGGLWGLSAF